MRCTDVRSGSCSEGRVTVRFLRFSLSANLFLSDSFLLILFIIQITELLDSMTVIIWSGIFNMVKINTLASSSIAWILYLVIVFGCVPLYAVSAETAVLPMNVLHDEGKFTYFVNEELVGASRFIWHEDGSFENDFYYKLRGKILPGNFKVEVDDQGAWTSLAMESFKGKVEATRSGLDLKLIFGGLEQEQTLKPGSAIMEDMSPALMSQVIALYDHEKAGAQEFPLFFAPALQTKAIVEYVETFERFAQGREQTFKKYTYDLTPVYHIVCTVDENNRVCLAEYPAQHGVFLREGYEALCGSGETGREYPLLSQPDFDVIEEKNAGIPMRDDIALATDIYRPDGEGPFPVILVRTPYHKEVDRVVWQARFYARRGYVFAVQDVRGRFDSPGEWQPFFHEADDGFDTIEWLAKQPWSNGKVGMIGGSYLGWVQWFAASRKPPHLATMIPNVSPPEPYYNFPYENGALLLGGALWWIDVVEKKATADLTGVSFAEAFDKVEPEKLMHLPVTDLDEMVLGKKCDYWREWLAHSGRNDYWRKLDYLEAMRDVDIPVFHQTGWFDGDGVGTKLNYLGMKRHGHKFQKMVVGPWGHTDTDTRIGHKGNDWGPRAVIDLQTSYLRWMDRWLKGIENGIDEEPLVSLFVMGANDWVHGDAYPLEGTKMTRFYLHSDGDAAGFEEGRGTLGMKPPTGRDTKPDRYTYDPADPTPASPRGRTDLLVYKTPPATERMAIAGPVTGVLYAASSAKDTDWVMRLAKTAKDGQTFVLCKGIVRARFRNSLEEPELLVPGKVYEYHLDMWHTGVSLDKGDQLVLVVASALFPSFSRNLNTGERNETGTRFLIANQSVYHDAERPSHIVLPVITLP